MGFRKWLTRNATKTAETVVVQTKEKLQQSMETRVVNKGNAAFTIGKLVLLGVIFVIAGKDVAKTYDRSDIPIYPVRYVPQREKLPNITINNYMNERTPKL